MTPDDESVLMDFADAMRAVQDGLTVRREAWEDAQAKVCLRFGQIQIRIGDTWHPWLISDIDVAGKDWTL